MPDIYIRLSYHEHSFIHSLFIDNSEHKIMLKEGDKIPAITLKQMTADGPADVSLADYCAGRKVVIFACSMYFHGRFLRHGCLG